MQLAGTFALVTGASGRIGREIALELARAKANVAITYLSSVVNAHRTVEELIAMGVEAVAVRLDLAEPESIADVVGEVEARLGPVDVLVNNASYFEPTPFPTGEHASWYSTFDVLVHGPYRLANEVAPGMIDLERGTIVNMVDLSAWHPWPDRGAHSVAKSALLALTRQLAVELAPSVAVNAVAPGPTIPAASFGDEQIGRLARRTLQGRWGDPVEVARAVRFLAESSSITGDCITLDGGERWGHVRERFED
ncbi:MAG: SDR family oxidoreductase [Actinobacteria bacterium]|nr:SDR family oxidoreductase [Actinomycetota bacterium]